MLRHDPLAPMARAKVADWHQEADLRRLRRSARPSARPSDPNRARSLDLLGQLMHYLRGLVAATIAP
jgi:hypothetical protein